MGTRPLHRLPSIFGRLQLNPYSRFRNQRFRLFYLLHGDFGESPCTFARRLRAGLDDLAVREDPVIEIPRPKPVKESGRDD